LAVWFESLALFPESPVSVSVGLLQAKHEANMSRESPDWRFFITVLQPIGGLVFPSKLRMLFGMQILQISILLLHPQGIAIDCSQQDANARKLG
jgi:hypothetical protein